MTAAIWHVTFDCADPDGLARFWAAALGYSVASAEADLVRLVPPRTEGGGRRPSVLFFRVPEPKSVKNRVHVDLQPDGDGDAEVERLVGLGATVRSGQARPPVRWAVMADPEGNEFCVRLGAAERKRG